MTQFNQLHQEVRKILLTEWDPIALRNVPQAQDEYDQYATRIAQMVISRRSIVELSEYLLHLETSVLGLEANRERARAVAEKLWSMGRSGEP
ncbi:MAG: hypothetical protein WEC82_05710 [Xanthobacteraceae bacterium]